MVVASFGLPLDILDETEHLTQGTSQFCAQMHRVCRNTREHIILKHDVCEDG